MNKLTRKSTSQAPKNLSALEEIAEFASLSEDQDSAAGKVLASIEDGKETILVGPAGSGKTTLLKYIMRKSGRDIVIGCPTGKAAQRASQVTGFKATTIHKLLYKKVQTDVKGELLFSDPKRPCSRGELLVIDEGGMLGKKLYTELMDWLPDNSPVLIVADKEQLSPVRDTWGPDLDNPTAALEQVHRQAADNPIIGYATAIRTGKGDQWLRDWDLSSSDAITLGDGANAAVRWHLERKTQGLDSTMLTFTHNVRRAANYAVRAALGFQDAVEVGDRLLIKSNSTRLGLMNGEVIDVEQVEYVKGRPTWRRIYFEGGQKQVVVNTDYIEKNPKDYWNWQNSMPTKTRYGFPFVHVWYGDCLTTHSAQGSQWDEVAFLWGHHFKRRKSSRKQEDQDFARRFQYTTTTRAVEKFAIFAV